MIENFFVMINIGSYVIGNQNFSTYCSASDNTNFNNFKADATPGDNFAFDVMSVHKAFKVSPSRYC